jgi:hypothetical protein
MLGRELHVAAPVVELVSVLAGPVADPCSIRPRRQPTSSRVVASPTTSLDFLNHISRFSS